MRAVTITLGCLFIIILALEWGRVKYRQLERYIQRIIDEEVKRDDDEGPPR